MRKHALEIAIIASIVDHIAKKKDPDDAEVLAALRHALNVLMLRNG